MVMMDMVMNGSVDWAGLLSYWLGMIFYAPWEGLYDLLPWHEALSAWRLDFMHDFITGSLFPFIGFLAAWIGMSIIFGPFMGSMAAVLLAGISLFQAMPGASDWEILFSLLKKILGFYVCVALGLAPYVIPPVLTVLTAFSLKQGVVRVLAGRPWKRLHDTGR